MRWWVKELALVGCFGLHPALAASPTPLTLDYQAPAGCPEAASVEREVLRLAQLERSAPHQVRARLLVQAGESGFVLTLRAAVDGISGERRFEGGSCQSVTDAAVLTLALMLNPEAELPVPENAPDPVPPAREPARTRPAVQVARSSAGVRGAASAWPTRFDARALLGVHSGVLPDPGFELMAGAGVSLGPLSGSLLLGFMPAQTARIDNSGKGGDLWALTGSALFGWYIRIESFRFGPALGGEFSRVSGEGAGVSDPEAASISWAAAMGGLSADIALYEGVGLAAAVLGVAPLSRPSFFLEQLGPVHQPEPFGIKAYFGATLSLF